MLTTGIVNFSSQDWDWNKNICFHCIQRLDTVKISIVFKLIFSFKASSLKILSFSFLETNNLFLTLYGNVKNLDYKKKKKESRLHQTVLKKKNKVTKPNIIYFQTYYKAAIIQTMWYCYLYLNRKPRNGPIYTQLIDYWTRYQVTYIAYPLELLK